MTKIPDVSFLLPTKGRHDLLLAFVESIVRTVDVRWELIILYANPPAEASKLAQNPSIRLFAESEHFRDRPSWPQLMNFLLGKASGRYFMYASDDIELQPKAVRIAMNALDSSPTIGGAAMAYRNVSAAKPEWSEYGIDLTLGNQVLVNYGLINTALAKAVGGFNETYNFYCADGDLCLRLLQSGFRIVPCLEARVLHNNVLDRLKEGNNSAAEADIVTYRRQWTPHYHDVETILRLLPGKAEIDPLLPAGRTTSLVRHNSGKAVIAPGHDALTALHQAGLHSPGQPVRLHLGCGERHLDGYINIDHPPDHHAVMTPQADIFADIKELRFPDNCLTEIRLHHVFEHFNRVEALGLLIRWHRWLRVGGILHIETPDLAGSAKTILEDVPFKQKCAAVRHLAGDQTETWAYHVDHWFPERFHATFTHMGFGEPKLRTATWNHPPYLANITAIGFKTADLPTNRLLQAADELLWLSTVAASEIPTYEVWKRQLRNFLAYHPVHPTPATALSVRELLPPPPNSPPLSDIHNFNQRERDNWIASKAATIPTGSAILDVGAGTCPYRPLFAHCHYIAHDFKKYEGVKLGGGTTYGKIDLVGDITAISAPDATFDVVMCTEVLEHVPDPVAALREMVRLLKPGGRLLLTAPLGSGLHQEPFHYYGGFTRHFYEHFLPSMGVSIQQLVPNGGFFLHLAQECTRVAWLFDQHKDFHADRSDAVRELFAEFLPRYLHAMDGRYPIEAFTVGYFVEGTKQ